MTLPFQPNPNAPTGFGPPQAAAPAPGFAPSGPMTTAQVLQGIGEVDMQTRFPELPDGFNGQLKLLQLRTTRAGAPHPAYFFECEIAGSHTHPQLEKTIATIKINGFTSTKGRTYALRDLRALLTLLFAADGLEASSQLTVEQWAQVAEAAAAGRANGRTFGCQAKLLTKGVQPKTVHAFFAA